MDRILLSLAVVLVLALTAFSSDAGPVRHFDAGSSVDGAQVSGMLALPEHVAQAASCAVTHCGDHLIFIVTPELVTPRASVIVPAPPFTKWRENAVTRDPEPPRA